MRFWDSSALLPLCLSQPETPRAEAWLRDDAEMVVWWGSVIECASAFARLRRQRLLGVDGEETACDILAELAGSWYEVQPTMSIQRRVLRFMRVHSLSASDASQLAAAVEWAGGAEAARLATFDPRLQAVARLEGFAVD
ncbi:MAG: type II toxin-antitoxin system VapC family toxin [Gemmatimonadota bacterium]